MKKSTVLLAVAALGVFGIQQATIAKQTSEINQASEKIATMKNNNYKFATGKRAMKIEDGQHIKTDKFELQYVENNDGKWSAVIYPTDKNTRIVGQQGEGAKGLELDNVSSSDNGLTTIVDK